MPRALLWGAAGGIGRALGRGLVAQGWEVFSISREVAATAADADSHFEADLADDFAVRQAALAAAQHAESYACSIYAAGDILTKRVSDMNAQDWGRILHNNLTGAYLTTHHALPLLTPTAHIVFIGAISERLRLPGFTAYVAAKAGLEAFAEALGQEERTRKVLVVRPGAVDTPLWQKVSMRLPKGAWQADDLATQIISAIATGRTGTLDL
jgi:NAD(P)-dependent dehydrogenase (short-subunit alcohol dehydrogenase family)